MLACQCTSSQTEHLILLLECYSARKTQTSADRLGFIWESFSTGLMLKAMQVHIQCRL